MNCGGIASGELPGRWVTSSLPGRGVFVSAGKSLPIIMWSPRTVVASTPGAGGGTEACHHQESERMEAPTGCRAHFCSGLTQCFVDPASLATG